MFMRKEMRVHESRRMLVLAHLSRHVAVCMQVFMRMRVHVQAGNGVGGGGQSQRYLAIHNELHSAHVHAPSLEADLCLILHRFGHNYVSC